MGLLGGLLVAATATVDTATAVLGLVPGGAGEMVAAAAVLGADSAVVALMATVRLVLVLATVPLLLRLVVRLG